MTKIARRKPQSAQSGESAPTGPTPPLRMQDALHDLEDVQVFGVDPEQAKAALRAYLSTERPGMDRPYCTCTSIRGWAFDCQVGVYLHAVPECWKPSKAYYEGALRAGVLGEVPLA